jgi:hypothetical protein
LIAGVPPYFHFYWQKAAAAINSTPSATNSQEILPLFALVFLLFYSLSLSLIVKLEYRDTTDPIQFFSRSTSHRHACAHATARILPCMQGGAPNIAWVCEIDRCLHQHIRGAVMAAWMLLRLSQDHRQNAITSAIFP